MSDELMKPPSTIEVSMGTLVSQYPIDRYKINEQTNDFITVLTENPIVTKTMYHDKIGFRFHESEVSIQKGLLASIHYGFLIAVWNTDKAGTKIVDNTYTIYALYLSKDPYQSLVRKRNLNGDLRQLVLQVNPEGDIKYQKMIFEVATTFKPPYMYDKDLFNKIKQDVKDFKQYLPYVIGSVISDDRFVELWNTEGLAVEQPEDKKFQGKGLVQNTGMKEITQSVNQAQLKDTDFKFEETPASQKAIISATSAAQNQEQITPHTEVKNEGADKSGMFNFEEGK